MPALRPSPPLSFPPPCPPPSLFIIVNAAVAILPQLLLLQRSRNVDNLTAHYVAMLGVYRWVPLSFSFFRSHPSACPYHRSISKRFLSSPSHPSRACYVVNWIWRYVSEGHVDWRSWMGGLVQVGLYADFMSYYRQAWVRGTGMRLPS